MTSLVSMQEASDHLRRDADDGDDADLTLKIEAASQAVMQYLDWTEVPADVPAVVKAATLNLIGEMYRERDGEMSGQNSYGYGYLPVGVIALLYPLRTPSLA
ncbi:MAG: head-tail connector protein [Castellaniella sp.]|nr:head-tail connector protein [Castellaniella sp.]